MPVFGLTKEIVFPSPELAEPDGLLAAGGDLAPARLLAAYRQGIFPWYSGSEPILWWSPPQRMVLLPEEFHLSRRLARTIRQRVFDVCADKDFPAVIKACASVRRDAGLGTWITEAMQDAYVRLHELGFAHSIECRSEGELIGGLYGVCLDRIFFGESMFSIRRDASKTALAALVRQAVRLGIKAIDCQMTTAHLLRFGSREMERQTFRKLLDQHVQCILPQPRWQLEGQDEQG